jgi:hypothetical protein
LADYRATRKSLEILRFLRARVGRVGESFARPAPPRGGRHHRADRLILDQRDRNPLTGAEFVVPALANPRFTAFTLPALSRAEVADAHRDLVRRLGAARDALWIPETGDTRAEMNRRAIWGAVNQPGEEAAAARGSFPLLNRSFRIVERL